MIGMHEWQAMVAKDEAQKSEIARLTAALERAVSQVSDLSTKLGRAEGKLLASETHGVVEGWKRRAEAAEKALAEAEARSAALVAEAKEEGMRVADTFDDLISEARTEAGKAMRKFPQPNYVISKIAEEAGEVVKAAIHAAEGRETMDNLRGEMRQVIAMLYRLWVEGDQVHGLGPVAPAAEKEPKP